MSKSFWSGAVFATAICLGGLGWRMASATETPAGAAVCMRAQMTWSKPAANAEEFMNEQIGAGRVRFVSLAMGDSPGLMCAW